MNLVDWLEEQSLPSRVWFVKRLSANDTLASGGHQAGPYIPKDFFVQNLSFHSSTRGIKSSQILQSNFLIPTTSSPTFDREKLMSFGTTTDFMEELETKPE